MTFVADLGRVGSLCTFGTARDHVEPVGRCEWTVELVQLLEFGAG
ncbi:MAG: hypothetical protein ACKV2T_43825 [Kofleriaceae bacterium]